MAVDPKSPIADEIATAARDIDLFAGWITRIDNPDPVLRSEAAGRGIRLYDEIARDAHAASVLQTRALAVIGREWEVLPASGGGRRADRRAQQIADFVREAIAGTNFDQARQEILLGVLYGFYVAEVIWRIDTAAGRIVPETIRAKHPRRFVFTPARELRLLTPESPIDGETVPPRKFIVFTFGSSDNPYGCGLGQKLWFPVWFKKHGIKFWMQFLEKFGMPTVTGKYPPGTDPEQQQKLMEALKAIQTDTAIKYPDTMEIGLLEAARTGRASYEEICDYMDRQISKAVLGQTLTTEVKGEGSYAASKTHDEVRGDIVKADADLLCETLNRTLVPWIVDWNFPGVASYPRIWIRCDDEQDLKPLAERDRILAHDIGLAIPKRYFHETYGIPEPEGGEETLGGNPSRPVDGNAPPANGEGANFGDRRFADPKTASGGERGLKSPLMPSLTPDQRAIEDLVAEVLPRAADGVQAVSAAIAAAIGKAESWEELHILLAEALADRASGAEMEELLARAMLAAEMWGRHAAAV